MHGLEKYKDPLIQRALECFLRWHNLEQNLGELPAAVVDFNLLAAPAEDFEPYGDRFTALQSLNALSTDFGSSLGSSPSEDELFVASKLQAATYLLRALTGEQIDFFEYVKNTMGITPSLVSQTEIEESKAALYNYAETHNFDVRNHGRNTKISSPAEIERSFRTLEREMIPKLMEWLGLTFELDYISEIVNENVYWTNWISTNEAGQILIRFNVHESHLWYPGQIETLVAHEVGAHAVHAAAWKQEILAGRMHPLIGFFSVFSAEQFVFEGLALSLPLFFPGELLSEHGWFSYHRNVLYYNVYNNAYIRANQGEQKEDIANFVRKFLPWESNASIERDLNNSVHDPLLRTYQYIYGFAFHWFRKLHASLNEDARRVTLRNLFMNIYRPETLMNTYHGALR